MLETRPRDARARCARPCQPVRSPVHLHRYTAAILEYCPGGSLQRHLQKLGTRARDRHGLPAAMGEAEVLSLGSQLLGALQHLHGLGVVHRDLKPANILFAGPAHLKLCDFGFARRCSASAAIASGGSGRGGDVQQTEADARRPGDAEGSCPRYERLHTICGTPIYMAPELTRDTTTGYCKLGYEGPPVDMWALGTVLYEMLHNQVCFSGSSGPELYRRIRKGSHAAFREDLSKAFRALIKSCLVLNPAKRPTADMLAAAMLPLALQGSSAAVAAQQ